MTDRPYTDDDLRAEAGLALSALVHLPNVEEIATSLRDSYVPHLHADGDEATWGQLLDQDGLTEAARRVQELMVPAAPVGDWAVNLGADGLEPGGHTLQLGARDGADGEDEPQIRMHFAFAPDLPDDDRDRFVMELSKVIARNL